MSIYRIKFGSELKKILLCEKTFRKNCFVVINIFFQSVRKISFTITVSRNNFAGDWNFSVF